MHSAGFVANTIAGGLNGFDRGFSEFHEVWKTLGSRGDVFRKALAPWLARNAERRFFAYLHFREPHFPYNPEPPFDTKFGPDGPIPRSARGDMSYFTDVNQGRRPFSEAEREHLVRLYDGNLAFADQEVGAIRRAFESAGSLGQDRRHRHGGPRRGAFRARLDRPQRAPLRGERPRPADRPFPEGHRARRSASPGPRRLARPRADHRGRLRERSERRAPTGSSRGEACCR